MPPQLIHPSLKSPNTLTVIACLLLLVSPFISPFIIVGASSDVCDRVNIPLIGAPVSPDITHFALTILDLNVSMTSIDVIPVMPYLLSLSPALVLFCEVFMECSASGRYFWRLKVCFIMWGCSLFFAICSCDVCIDELSNH